MPSNIESVIDDVGDVQESIEPTFVRYIDGAMGSVQNAVRTHITKDAIYTTQLLRAVNKTIRRGVRGPRFLVYVDSDRAPYAPFVEFGTGSRTNRTAPQAPSVDVPPPDPDSTPRGYPYEAPDFSSGLVAALIEWSYTKPSVENGTGAQIARTMARHGMYAHPFIRPAWFGTERQVIGASHKALDEVTN